MKKGVLLTYFSVILLITFLFFNCQQPSGGSGGSDGGDDEKKPAITYSVNYNGNGNSTGNIPVTPEKYAAGQIVTVQGNTGNLIKINFQFAGWNTEPDGSGITYTQGQTFNMGTADITLYAIWTANPTYTVTYNGNDNTGGTVPVDTTNYQQGQTVFVLGNTGNLIKTGFQFAGWNTESDGSGTTYTQGQIFSMGSADITLYAVWTVNPTYTVTYNGNNNTGGTVPIDTTNYQKDQIVSVLGNTGNLVRANYQFAGWNTSSDGNGTTYSQGQTFSMGSADITLYAIWTNTIKIYVSGQDKNEEACFWTVTTSNNITKTVLSSSSSGYPEGESITVSGDTVYVAGDDGDNHSCYWGISSQGINKVILDSGKGRVKSIGIYNGMLYVSGKSDGSNNYWPCYWNYAGNITILNALGQGTALSFCIYNYKHYVVGEDEVGFCYWIGRTRNSLGNNKNISSDDRLIAINNNGTFYIVGEESGSACYWSGTEATGLTTTTLLDSNGSAANSIFVDNNIVYTAGKDSSGNACFWTGTTKTILESGSNVTSMYVYNGMVYTTGKDSSGNACFWTGTTKTVLESSSKASSIFVK